MNSSIKNVAVIMDGNGRWANSRLRPRFWGHVRGSHVVSQIVEEADELNINSLTLYAFSTENWSRPNKEINTLFKLLDKFLAKEKKRIISNNIRFKVIGNISNLPEKTKAKIQDLEDLTVNFDGLKLYFAFSYGSREEILKSVNNHITDNPGELLTAEKLESELFAPEIPNIDLLIRTSGEQRISNFLLWQIAYAELIFTNTLWPDFSRAEFRSIIESVSNRQRRFGGLESSVDFLSTQKKAIQNQEQFNKRS